MELNVRMAVSVRVLRYNREADIEEYLVMHSTKRNAWEFPGGKLKSGETTWDTAIRELEEEVGKEAASSIHVSEQIVGFFSNPTDDGNTFAFVMFGANLSLGQTGDNIKLTREHDEFRWVNIFDMRKLKMSPRLRIWSESSNTGIFHRNPTESSMFPWYEGEDEKVGKKKQNCQD